MNGERIPGRSCRHCGGPLFRIPVKTTVLKSPFNKDNPAVLCERCDSPGELPKVPNA